MGIIVPLDHFLKRLKLNITCFPHFQNLGETIQDLEPSHRVGPLLLLTEKLKLGLITETKNWKVAYGRHLNEKCAREMDEILEFFDNMTKVGKDTCCTRGRSTISISVQVNSINRKQV